MRKLYVLWGVKIGFPAWMEEVLAESRVPFNLEKAQAWAMNNGFTNIRIMETFDGEKPRFH